MSNYTNFGFDGFLNKSLLKHDSPKRMTTGDVNSMFSAGGIDNTRIGDYLRFTTAIAFSATDNNTAAWTSGTINFADGTTTETIAAGNTGNITATTYVYYDASLRGVLTTSTSPKDAVGNKITLLAIVEKVTDTTKKCKITPIYATGLVVSDIQADQIRANSITVGQMATSAGAVFSETFESGEFGHWTLYDGSGEMQIVTGGVVGDNILRIGNTSGDDMQWMIYDENIPFDPTKLYRIKIRIRRPSGSGTCYVGWAGIAADGSTFVNSSGGDTYYAQHYHCAAGSGPGTSWTEYIGYTYGTASSGVQTAGTLDNPSEMHEDVHYIRPLIVVNYDSVAGVSDIDSFIVEEVHPNISGWADSTDTTKIDGGHIYDNTITTTQLGTTIISGGKIVTGLLTADNIQAGTLTGRTIQTASTGQRVVINGSNNDLRFYNSSGLETLRIDESDLFLYASGSQSPYGQGTIFFRYGATTSVNIASIDANYALSGDWSGWNTLDVKCTYGAGAVRIYTDLLYIASDTKSAGDIYPGTNTTFDLGTSTVGWRYLYVNQVYAGGSSGNAYKVGDDVWFKDIDLSNTVGVYGVQSGTWGYVKAAGFTTSSSRKYKKHIKDASDNAVDGISKLRFRRYKHKVGPLKEREKATNRKDHFERDPNKEYFGLITEEIPEEMRDIVDEDGNGIQLGPYLHLVARAVQQLTQRLEKIEDKMAGGVSE